MGITHLRIRVKKDATSRAVRDLEFLVDSGAVNPVVPSAGLKSLRVKPFKKTRFNLANGESIVREVGTAHFMYKGHEGGAPVIFDETNDKPLLGATTLEALELALNPLSRNLYPLQMTLMGDVSAWLPISRSPLRRRKNV